MNPLEWFLAITGVLALMTYTGLLQHIANWCRAMAAKLDAISERMKEK